MILIFEQDTREHDGRCFGWRPELFRGRWRGRRNWRLMWGLWSISYYPSPGLRDFMEHIEAGNTRWQPGP
jgi:hypothetical protein